MEKERERQRERSCYRMMQSEQESVSNVNKIQMKHRADVWRERRET